MHKASSTIRRGTLVALAALAVAGCGGGGSSGTGLEGAIRIDGSSTVAPLSEAAAERFQSQERDVRVTVGTSGTGGGFEKFCAGEIDIADASREIKDEERKACEAEGVVFERLHVANDGLALVVNPENDWAKCLTVDQLQRIWDRGSEVETWKDVDPSFPDVDLDLYGPGTDSGTFDYFTEAINGEEGRSRTDYQPSEDDNVIIQGVTGSRGGLGYFGLSYVEQNEGKVRAVEVDGGDGCVAPSIETVQSGDYTPLSRPLFIYPSRALLERAEGRAFLDFYVENATEIAEQALFVPLTDEQQAEAEKTVEELAG